MNSSTDPKRQDTTVEMANVMIGFLLTIIAMGTLASAVVIGPNSLPWAIPLFIVAFGGRIGLIFARRRSRRARKQVKMPDGETLDVAVATYPLVRRYSIRAVAAVSVVFLALAIACAVLAITAPPFRLVAIALTIFYLGVILAWAVVLRLNFNRAEQQARAARTAESRPTDV